MKRLNLPKNMYSGQFKPISTLLCCCLFLLTFSCVNNTDTSNLRITGSSHKSALSLTENPVFYFSQDLVPDSVLLRWQEDPYLKWEPEVEGVYRWTSANALEFSPSLPFSPGTNYVIYPTVLLARYLEEVPMIDNDQPWSVNTPDLDLQSVNLYWHQSEGSENPAIRADINFNFPVAGSEVSNLLKVKIDGKDNSFVLLEDGTSSTVKVELDKFNKDEELPVEFSIRSGLNALGGNTKTERKFLWVTEVPSRNRLEVRNLTASHNGTHGTARLVFNQQVNTDNAKSFLSVSPSVEYEIESSSNGFELVSEDFNPDESYRLVLKAGYTSEVGGKLKSNYETSFTFGKLKPEIAFADQQAHFLGSKGARNLALVITSVPKVKVTISKIFENNLLQFANDNQRYDWGRDDDGDWYNYRYRDIQGRGEKVYEQEIETSKLAKTGGAYLLNIDFKDKLERFEGIYLVTVESTEKHWLQSSTIVSISDIGLVARNSEDQVFVFANSISKAKPISGLAVNFYSDHNQLMHEAFTDADGVVVFDRQKDETEDFKVGMITAREDGDFTYLNFRKTRISSSRFPVGGTHLKDVEYDAYLYGERDIYRPGETINLATVIRSLDQSVPSSMPLRLQIIQPSGQDWKNIRKTLDNEGSADASFQLAASAPTGRWMAKLFTSNDVLLSTLRFSVEEFVPDRIRLNGSIDKETATPGDAFSSSVQALNFYGPPASNRNFTTELSLRRKALVSEKLPDWTFSVSGNDDLSLQEKQGKTTENGIAEATFNIPTSYADMGLLEGKVLTTVFDETGRPVYDQQIIRVPTQEVFFGIGPVDYYVSTKKLMDFPVAAVDVDGNILDNQTAHIEIVKFEWESNLVRSGRSYSYRSNRRERVVLEDEIPLTAGQTTYSWQPGLSGSYAFRIKKPGAKHFVENQFYAYGWGSTDYRSFDIDREGRIDIVADKTECKTGDQVDFLFKTPFDGRLLVTLERDKVFEYRFLETDNKSASVSFRMPEKYVPTVYVTATLIRPHEGSNLPLTVAHGFQPIKVEELKHKMEVTIDAPSESRSLRTQKVKIKAAPNAKLTIAAVDQGILQITGFEDPDPYKWFFRKRALEVESYDLYALLFPELMANSGLSGGGDGSIDESAKRLNPIDAERFKMLSEWSGIVQADANGNLEWDLELPKFSGEVRIMVAGWKGNQYGGSSVAMTVADPIVVTAALPRFISPGDKIEVPVMLANTTKENAKGQVSIKTGILTAATGETVIDVDVPAGQEQQVWFQLRAEQKIGAEKISVEAEAFGEIFREEIEIPVRPASGLQKVNGAGFATAGKNTVVSMAADHLDLLTGDKLVVSRSPLTQFADDLEYLVGYPYGCAEQTVSKAFPQIYYSDMVSKMSLSNDETQNHSSLYYVNQAIQKLQNMQMHHGGLSYWPGSGYESWWGTAYALHFLHEADKAGYQVDQQVKRNMTAYLRNRVKEKKTFVYRYRRNSNLSREVAVKEAAYSLYVLALIGEPDKTMMNYYRSRTDQLSLDGQYLLAAAYGLAGDKKQFDAILPMQYEGEDPSPVFGGSFYSALRDQALALNALLEIDPQHPQVGPMARYVSDQLRIRKYCNTQERSFGFLALGKLAAVQDLGNASATVLVDGREVGQFTGKDLVLTEADLRNKEVQIKTSGSGSVYYFWEVEGISTSGAYTAEDRFLRVRKSFYNRYGKPLSNLNSIVQNDLIVVQISIQTLAGGSVDNVAITDILPAGFEIENTRLREVPDMDWIKNESKPDYLDVRDDRINLFTTVYGTVAKYYYIVRAVSPGVFRMGPVGAEAMYNGEYHSYHGAGTVTIKAK